MSDYTKHLRLIKPAGNEYYNVDHFNHNAELIDKETEDLSNKVTEIQKGATREKAGIVQFGIEEGKALEGMMLARLAGCVGYGGDIQEPGVKDINYIYYDRNTRKMYKCLNQNSDVSANVANFIPLDNNSLLDRLENLYKIEYKDLKNNIDKIDQIPKTQKLTATDDYAFIDLYFVSNHDENINVFIGIYRVFKDFFANIKLGGQITRVETKNNEIIIKNSDNIRCSWAVVYYINTKINSWT